MDFDNMSHEDIVGWVRKNEDGECHGYEMANAFEAMYKSDDTHYGPRKMGNVIEYFDGFAILHEKFNFAKELDGIQQGRIYPIAVNKRGRTVWVHAGDNVVNFEIDACYEYPISSVDTKEEFEQFIDRSSHRISEQVIEFVEACREIHERYNMKKQEKDETEKETKKTK